MCVATVVSRRDKEEAETNSGDDFERWILGWELLRLHTDQWETLVSGHVIQPCELAVLQIGTLDLRSMVVLTIGARF